MDAIPDSDILVSIHAPVKERPPAQPKASWNRFVSIHAPVKERLGLHPKTCYEIMFQFTPL